MAIAASTGWTERFIRWELPLPRGWAYYHAARLMAGERCIWPEALEEEEEWFEGLRDKWSVGSKV
jgi:hypothetical protein